MIDTAARELRAEGVAIETVFVSALVVLIVQSEIPEAFEAGQIEVLPVPETVMVGVVPEIRFPKASFKVILTTLFVELLATELFVVTAKVDVAALAPAGETTVAAVLQAVVKLPEVALMKILSAFS